MKFISSNLLIYALKCSSLLSASIFSPVYYDLNFYIYLFIWKLVYCMMWEFTLSFSRTNFLSIIYLKFSLQPLFYNSSFFCLYVLFWPPTYIGEGHLLYLVYQFKCSSHPETPSQRHPEIMFSQISGYPVTQSNWYIQLTITPSFPTHILRTDLDCPKAVTIFHSFAQSNYFRDEWINT